MSAFLRILLIIGAVATAMYVIRKIHRSSIPIEDSIFWWAFAFLLALFGIFPQIVVAMAKLIGVDSPANLVFLIIIFVILIKLFSISLSISQLNAQIAQLAQRYAMDAKDYADKEQKCEKSSAITENLQEI